MSELVTTNDLAESPAKIYIGTESRFAKGAGHAWCYKLTWVGPQRLHVCMDPPSTTHAHDVMFIAPQTENGTVSYVAYEGRVVNEDLEQRAAVLRTAARFWEAGEHEWQTNAFASRASYEAEWAEPRLAVLGLECSHAA